ncbi:Tn7 transposase TnsA N-terminal domain-containing protein [Phormidesmis sp. 146-12]
MLSSHAFNDWCQQLQVNSVARAVIEQVRNAAPSRQVQGRRKNVCGSYPSRKMGLTIQFESHRNELARIHELEHDQMVLEYYDQPPPIELVYSSKIGRRTRHQYTPDFFVLRTDGVEWEECKTETELIKLAQENSNRYCQDIQGKWHCPPGGRCIIEG